MLTRLNMVPLFLLLSAVTIQRISGFVPVVMWGSGNNLDYSSPPLKKIPSEDFSDLMKKILVDQPHNVAVFVQGELSSEDLQRKDSNGENIYTHLENALNYDNFSKYFSYVENPVDAFRSLKDYFKISDFDDKKVFDDSQNLFIVKLDEPKNDEDRLTSLRRHDKLIHETCNKIKAALDDAICILTGLRSSWVEPNLVSASRRLLQVTEPSPQNTTNFFIVKTWALFYTKLPPSLINLKTNQTFNLTFTDPDAATGSITKMKQVITITTWAKAENVNETASAKRIKLTFSFITSNYTWRLENITLTMDTSIPTNTVNLNTTSDIIGSYNFSFHTPSPVIFNSPEYRLKFYTMQIELFGGSDRSSFSPAEDTVGFFTIPIWSGLFITSLLISIVFIGLSLIFDIKTMDQFDDPKGKTVTINASE